MAHQLGLLLLLGLLASNAIAMLLLQRTGSLIHPLSRNYSVERLVTAHHIATAYAHAEASLSATSYPRAEALPPAAAYPRAEALPPATAHPRAEALPPATAYLRTEATLPASGPAGTIDSAHPLGNPSRVNQLARLLGAMNTEDARFWIEAEPQIGVHALRPEESRLARTVRQRLGLSPDVAIGMQLERMGGGDARAQVFSRAGWAELRLRTSIALPGGLSLNAVQYPAGAYDWAGVLAYSLPVTTVPVLLIVMFFIIRVVRPVKTLAQATERVSRGEWISPLPLTGPLEARELTTAFNTMQASIARHVEGRTRMLAAVSHDLNTPITELRLQLELLEPGEARDDMLASLDELRAMVRETLAFVRGDAVQEATQTAPLTPLLDDLAKRYRLMNQPLTWHGAAEVQLTCRPLALKRALTNLLDNALQHGGATELSLQQEADGTLRIEILDQGAGLPQAWLDKVFEPFVQLGRGGADARSGGGLGLGLAIARACIQAHGGELSLENRPPAGLCAVVRLPAAILRS